MTIIKQEKETVPQSISLENPFDTAGLIAKSVLILISPEYSKIKDFSLLPEPITITDVQHNGAPWDLTISEKDGYKLYDLAQDGISVGIVVEERDSSDGILEEFAVASYTRKGDNDITPSFLYKPINIQQETDRLQLRIQP